MMCVSVFVSRKMVERKGFGMWKFDNKHPVDIQVIINDPFFNGKNVCKILGYVNAKKASQELLDEDGKKSLSELGPISVSNYHQGKAVYISESCLYSLIL